MEQRILNLHSACRQNNIDAVLITKPENRRYFSGFTGTAGMLVSGPANNVLITDFRYTEQAAMQASNFEIVKHGADITATLASVIEKLQVKVLGFEADFVTYDEYSAISASLQGTAVLKPIKLDRLRMVKDTVEIDKEIQACSIVDQAFQHILPFLKPGINEAEIALEIEFYMRRLGAEKSGFDIIVASGRRSALPHGVASDKRLETGDFVTMDFGAVYRGYHSDITRTVVLGSATAKQKEIYQVVYQAQLAGLEAVKPGITGKEIDAVSRNIITAAGFGEFFGHGLGHGVGLAIHEEPKLSPVMGDVVLEENMLVTVEPGIYLPNYGGVRIEDTVLVTAAGGKPLTASSKKLIELE